jgi:hypothetical protein
VAGAGVAGGSGDVVAGAGVVAAGAGGVETQGAGASGAGAGGTPIGAASPRTLSSDGASPPGNCVAEAPGTTTPGWTSGLGGAVPGA